MLRRSRHRVGRLRMELSAADDRDPARGSRRRRRPRRARARHLHDALPAEAPAAARRSSRDDGVAPVLLIDELDRTDEPFEAYLLEVLVRLPGHDSRARRRSARPTPPVVVITSNRTREIHDAIKRRCLYHWVDYPDALRELAIVRRKCPQAPESLAREIVAFTQRLRAMDLFKAPGIAETLDWAEALVALDRVALDPQTVADTAGVLLKYQDDIGALTPGGRGAARRRSAGGGHPAVTLRPASTRVARGRAAARAEGPSRRERRCTSCACCAPPDCRSARRRCSTRSRRSRRSASRTATDFRAALAAVLVSRHEQLPIFEQAFDLFWRNPKLLEKLIAALLPTGSRPRRRGRRPSRSCRRGSRRRCCRRRSPTAASAGRRRDRPRRGVHVLAARGPAAQGLRDDDRRGARAGARDARATAAAAAGAADAAHAPSPRGHRVDLRATLRRTTGAAGALAPLAWRARTRRTPPLVVLCDISGSMDRYARMLLHFLHAITNDRDRVHVLLFGTRLTNITRHLQHRDVDVALARVTRGGRRLVGRHAHRRLPRRVQPPLVAAAARPERGRAADQRRARRRRRRRPRRRDGAAAQVLPRGSSGSIRCCATRDSRRGPAGIRAMLPHVDDFLPVHNLESLTELAGGARRPARARTAGGAQRAPVRRKAAMEMTSTRTIPRRPSRRCGRRSTIPPTLQVVHPGLRVDRAPTARMPTAIVSRRRSVRCPRASPAACSSPTSSPRTATRCRSTGRAARPVSPKARRRCRSPLPTTARRRR